MYHHNEVARSASKGPRQGPQRATTAGPPRQPSPGRAPPRERPATGPTPQDDPHAQPAGARGRTGRFRTVHPTTAPLPPPADRTLPDPAQDGPAACGRGKTETRQADGGTPCTETGARSAGGRREEQAACADDLGERAVREAAVHQQPGRQDRHPQDPRRPRTATGTSGPSHPPCRRPTGRSTARPSAGRPHDARSAAKFPALRTQEQHHPCRETPPPQHRHPRARAHTTSNTDPTGPAEAALPAKTAPPPGDTGPAPHPPTATSPTAQPLPRRPAPPKSRQEPRTRTATLTLAQPTTYHHRQPDHSAPGGQDPPEP